MAWTHYVPNLNSLDLAPLGRKIFDEVYDLQAVGDFEVEKRIDAAFFLIKYISLADFSNGFIVPGLVTTGAGKTDYLTQLRVDLVALHLTPYFSSAVITAIQALEPAVGVAATATQQQTAANFVKNTAPYLVQNGNSNIDESMEHIVTYLYFSLGSNFLHLLTSVK